MRKNFLYPLITLLLALLGSPSIADANLLIEGHLEGGSGIKTYDLTIEVGVKPGPHSTIARPLQSIRIPQVKVEDGRFAISLDTDLAGEALASLSIEVQARPFGSYRAFEPAVVSRVSDIP